MEFVGGLLGGDTAITAVLVTNVFFTLPVCIGLNHGVHVIQCGDTHSEVFALYESGDTSVLALTTIFIVWSRCLFLFHRHIFGLKGSVKNNIWYIDENIVVFPCGHNTIIYNTETKDQQFVSLGASEGITALAVTPNKR